MDDYMVEAQEEMWDAIAAQEWERAHVERATEKPFCLCDEPFYCRCDSDLYQTARGS